MNDVYGVQIAVSVGVKLGELQAATCGRPVIIQGLHHHCLNRVGNLWERGVVSTGSAQAVPPNSCTGEVQFAIRRTTIVCRQALEREPVAAVAVVVKSPPSAAIAVDHTVYRVARDSVWEVGELDQQRQCFDGSGAGQRHSSYEWRHHGPRLLLTLGGGSIQSNSLLEQPFLPPPHQRWVWLGDMTSFSPLVLCAEARAEARTEQRRQNQERDTTPPSCAFPNAHSHCCLLIPPPQTRLPNQSQRLKFPRLS